MPIHNEKNKSDKPSVHSKFATETQGKQSAFRYESQNLTTKTLLQLQRTYGNQTVQRWLHATQSSNKHGDSTAFIQRFLPAQSRTIQREEDQKKTLAAEVRKIINDRKIASKVYNLGSIGKLSEPALRDLRDYLNNNAEATAQQIMDKIKEVAAKNYDDADTEPDLPVVAEDAEPIARYEGDVVTVHHPVSDVQLGKGEIDGGVVEIDMDMTNAGNTNPVVRGRTVFHKICDTFEENGQKVEGVKGLWDTTSDNMTTLNKEIASGTAVDDAVWKTFTGKMAKERGFSRQHIDEEYSEQNNDGTYKAMLVTFF